MQVRQIDLAGAQSKLVAWMQKKMPEASDISIMNFKKMGVVIPGDQTEYNTPGHMRLVGLLNLPAPRAPRQVTKELPLSSSI
jgi:hypothetical protein